MVNGTYVLEIRYLFLLALVLLLQGLARRGLHRSLTVPLCTSPSRVLPLAGFLVLVLVLAPDLVP